MAAYAALLSLAQTTHLNRTQDEFPFSYDAEEKVRSIHDYVNFLLLFFKEFPEKVNRWECRIRDVAFNIQDIIDVFLWQRLQSSHGKMKPSRVKLEDQLGNVVEEIGLIAGEVMEERPAYLPSSSSSSSSLSRLIPTGNDTVIGLQGDIMAIKERLCGQSSNLQVIPIVGMGGIGKTTLARTIYEDQLIVESFDFRAWVVVSQDYDPLRFRKTLLESVKLFEEQRSADEMDESEIALKVFRYFKSRRYLVVIDDVWGTHVWDDVRFIFPDDNNGSRIILTTRQSDVAVYPDSAGPLHVMQFMNDSQSWDLLKEKIFTNGYCPTGLVGIGKEIARKCAGLPLAVVLVAGFMAPLNKTRASWEEIAKNVNPVVGHELEEILSLSYTCLPQYLRPCFLYIGGFLENVNIRTSRLIRLWVAEGFVMHLNGCSKILEEEAEEYLEDLVKRNLVIATTRKSHGRIKSCSLHDMVRDFCKRKACEEKFLYVMDGVDLPQGLMNERRIIFSRSDIDKIWGPTFRTILCFRIQFLPTNLESYKLLRVLDALGVDLQELPSEVFELYHLRYLALTGSFILPSSVSNLVNLQTLIIHLQFGKLRGKYDYNVPRSLPMEILGLPQVRHLFFHVPYMLPYPLEGLDLPLENLQTLFLVNNVVWSEKILQLIPNVKRLGLTYTFNQDYHLHHLNDLSQIEKLKVIGNLGFSWSGQNPSFPCTLKKLTLVGGRFPWKDMAVVGSLPNLEVLKLLGKACDGETWVTTDDDFPLLKVLVIDDSHLQQWITQSSPLPMLKHLVLRSCWYLREIPEAIGEISTLELMDIKDCSHSLVDSAKKIEDDQRNCGNYDLQVHAGHEEIESIYRQMDLSPLRYVTSGNDALIGFDEDVMEIKQRLLRQSSKLQAVPIVGVSGVGKTTVARTVYSDPLISEHFDIRAWLTISRDYSPLKFGKILLSLVDSMEMLLEHMCGDKINEPEMQRKIYKNLMGRKYLVVMDNVWSIEVWDAFKNIFPNDGHGSRIMLTTRLPDVGFYANLRMFGTFIHWMHPIDEYRSWELLKQKVFENGNCPHDLEEAGKQIVQGSSGLPLAIFLLAGVLTSAADKTRAFWYEIAQRENPDCLPTLQEILYLSYSYLPHHLRPCFLYMGVFPEYQNIHASQLFKLWVDKGLLKHETGCNKSLEEEEAEKYLDDLVKRNLLNVTSRLSNGKIKTCSLHDMVRDFCITKAEEEKFIYAMDGPHLPQGLIKEQPGTPTRRSFFMLLKDVLFCKAS